MLSPSRRTLDRSVLKHSFLFTGVPGIGKSVFMIYFLCRYSTDDRFSDKRFATEFGRGEYCYYQPAKEAGEYYFSKQIDNGILRYTLLVVDMDEPSQPKSHVKCTLIFSTPNPVRYKQFLQNSGGIMYVLPTWTVTELRLINSNADTLYDRFEKLGGVARQVFRNNFNVKNFDHLTEYSGETVIRKFLRYGFGWTDFEDDDPLVYMNLPRDADGRFLY